MPHTTGCSMWHMLPTPIVVFVTYGVCDKYHNRESSKNMADKSNKKLWILKFNPDILILSLGAMESV